MKEIKKIIFFGDSICVGQYISIHKGWIPRISASMDKLGVEKNCTIIVSNSSQNGRTTRQALEVMAYEVQSFGADIIIIQFGMNDCNYWKTDNGLPRVSKKSFEANLHEIIDRAHKYNIKKIFLNTNHPSGRSFEKLPATNFTYQQSNKDYNDIIRKVAQESDRGVILNDIEKAFFNKTNGDQKVLAELLLPEPDLIHLSEKGHNLYFDIVYPNLKLAINEVLEKQSV